MIVVELKIWTWLAALNLKTLVDIDIGEKAVADKI